MERCQWLRVPSCSEHKCPCLCMPLHRSAVLSLAVLLRAPHRGDVSFVRLCPPNGKGENKAHWLENTSTPGATISTGTRHYCFPPLLSCSRLPLSCRGYEACLPEWVFAEETDVTSGRVGTVTRQPLSSLRQRSLNWIRKAWLLFWEK